MQDPFLTALTCVAAIGSGLIAGVFYAFSTFVMKALVRLPPEEGTAAMQSINVAVINPAFLGAFLGTTAACGVAIATALIRWNTPPAPCLLTGGALYFFGTFLVTIVFNVPLNNALAKLTRDNPDTPLQWADYVRRWTRWNHVRTAAALAAAASFTLALCLGELTQ